MRKSLNLRTLLSASALAAGVALAAPVLAQTAVDELTVTGRLDPNAPSVSAPVSYADLDLTTKWGQDELKSRVTSTAKDLCDKLGEGTSMASPGLGKSCAADAVSGAREQLKIAFATATPHGAPAPMAMAEPAPPMIEEAPAAPAYSAPVSTTATYTTSTVTNGPVPDTTENRARYGQPMSNGGQRTNPAGN